MRAVWVTAAADLRELLMPILPSSLRFKASSNDSFARYIQENNVSPPCGGTSAA